MPMLMFACDLQVCEPDQHGRQFCFAGPSPSADAITQAAAGAPVDVLLHEAWTGHVEKDGLLVPSTAKSATAAAALASALNTSCVLLTPRGSLMGGIPVASSVEQDRELCDATEGQVAASTVVAAPRDMHVAVFGNRKS